MNANQELFREKIGHLVTLPTIPEIATRLMRMINDPLASSNDVAGIIGKDPSLSAKVLRMANSAYFGVPGKTSTVSHAVVLLGFRVITTIVLSVTVFDLFPEGKRSQRLFDRMAFWRHSFGCGLIAKMLAMRLARTFRIDSEEAFCSGLLHDIGKVVLEQYLHDDFHRALKSAREESLPLYIAEKKILGFSHAEVAEWLISGWGLPASIGVAPAHHHDEFSIVAAPASAALCQAADWLCYQTGLVIDPGYTPPPLAEEVRRTFNISPAFIEDLQASLPSEVDQSFLFSPAC